MNQKIRMLQSLGAMLQPGETLMHPIYGILQEGGTQYFSFFGLTEKFLLIAVLSMDGTSVAHTIRVPLDVKSVKVKTTAIMRQKVIDITFTEGEPCHIIAAPRVLIIDSQKENLPRFLEYLAQKATGAPVEDVKTVRGTRIRRQLFGTCILMSFSIFAPLILFVFIVATEASVIHLLVGTLLGALFGFLVALPFWLLSLLNRRFFGKILCVADERGIHLENDFIPWEKVNEIVHYPRVLSLNPTRITHAIVAVQSETGKEYGVDIQQFPHYGLKKLKKYKPDLKITTDKACKRDLIIAALIPAVMILGMGVLPKFLK